jgi:diguanylate cyclase (GGDEF)-like protein
LLQQIAKRLQQQLSENDFAARLGGDEFIVLTESSREDVEALAKQIVDVICKPFALGPGEARIGASIGISDVSLSVDVDDAIHKADIAMYYSKRSDGCCYTFSSDLTQEILENSSESTYLRTER